MTSDGKADEEFFLNTVEESSVSRVVFKNHPVNKIKQARFHTRANHDYLESRLGKGHCIYCLNGCGILEDGKKEGDVE